MRGYFEIGICHGKTEHNLGTLWRSAFQLGASGIFSVASRYHIRQASDTYKAWRHVPLRVIDSFDAFFEQMPYGAPLVGVEMGGTPLADFTHPERAIYLLGVEDHGIPKAYLDRCHRVVSIPTVRQESLNVAVAGALVMYDRLVKS